MCLPIVCGNNRLDPGEACDDGNTVTGDGCSGDCASTELCGNGKVDPLKIGPNGPAPNEQCDDGNLISGDGCSSDCQSETVRWVDLDPAPPSAISASAMAYDAARRRIVMFGGVAEVNTKEIGNNETFEWTGSGWAHIPAAVAPAARWFHTMAYDPVRRRVVLFGGQDGDEKTAFGDTWEWDGRNWTLVATPTAPPPRSRAAMAYDGARKTIVLFGGIKVATMNDTWEWDGATWKPLTTATMPSPRFAHAMAYDPKRGKIVMAGGLDASDSIVPETWEYDGVDWKQVTTTTPIAANAGMTYDAVSGRTIAYGGVDAGGTQSTKTWAFDGQTWTDLGQTTPRARDSAPLAADPVSGQIVMFGGNFPAGTPIAETWLWNGATWSKPAAQLVPSPVMWSAAAYDPLHGQAWVFGGGDSAQPPQPLNELWSFDGATWTDHPVATRPPARMGAGLTYDVAHGQLVMLGGTADGSTPVPSDTWLWDGLQWSKATPTTSPPARYAHSMTYDPKRGRVVLFGGVGSTIYDDTWEWDGSDWHATTPTTRPPARAGHAATYDPVRGAVLITMGTTGVTATNDLWAWDGTAWTDVSATTPLPDRALGSLLYDGSGRRSIAFGGVPPGGSAFDDTWQWYGSQWQSILTPDRPPPRAFHASFPARAGAGVIVFGGTSASDAGVRLGDTWQLVSDNLSEREQCTLDVDNDLDGLTGCADSDCWAACTPLCPPGASCDPNAPHCGDGTCNAALESCRLCPQDCGACPAVCGDTFCDPGETAAACPGDCTP